MWLMPMLALVGCGGDATAVHQVGRGDVNAGERDGDVGGPDNGDSDAGGLHSEGGSGGEPGGGGAEGDTERKKLSDLNWAEQHALCQDFSPKAVRIEEAVNHGVCTLGGLRDGGRGLSCEAIVDQCAMWLVPIELENCDASAHQLLPDCPQLTVSQFRGCFEGILAVLESTYGALTCQSDPAIAEGVKVPVECTMHYDTCPELEKFEELFTL
jgi:hypothetical protein